jgi:hypothetical protein
MSEDLGKFDGQDVLTTSIKVTHAGDGLSQAMKVDPALLHMGDTVHVVLECMVADVAFKPIKDTTALNRVHTLKAGTATMLDVDETDVSELLRLQAERIRIAKEAEKGVTRLPGHESDPKLLHAEHEAGMHEHGLADKCPDCYPEPEPFPGE